MIIGIGVDTISIDRIYKAIQKSNSFINRVYSENEKALIDFEKNSHRTAEMAAGNFAAKEAVSKALGCGMSGLDFSDISVLRKASGAPHIELTSTALNKASDLCVKKIFVSITNTETEATAFVVLEG